MNKNTKEFFIRELHILEKEASSISKDALKEQKDITKDIIQLFDVFSKQKHDNLSANYTVNLFNKLIHFIPLSPLTGNDNEWRHLKDNIEYNIRFPDITRKDKDNSTAVWNDGVIYCEPDSNDWFSTKEHNTVEITFPFSNFERKLIKLNYKLSDMSLHEQVELHEYKELN